MGSKEEEAKLFADTGIPLDRPSRLGARRFHRETLHNHPLDPEEAEKQRGEGTLTEEQKLSLSRHHLADYQRGHGLVSESGPRVFNKPEQGRSRASK